MSFFTEKLTVSYDEALADYRACLAVSADAAAASAAAGEPWVPGYARNGSDWDCGTAPVPPATGEQTYVIEVPVVHIGSSHGSIQFTAYSYKAKNQNDAAGAINAIFWYNGQVSQVKSLLYGYSHWKSTTHHGFQCGPDRYTYIWNAMHIGGSDQWYTSTSQSEAHHSNDGYWHCNNAREHIRHYGDSTLDDSHWPSWFKYSIANVHYDDLDHNNPDSESGKWHLSADMSSLGIPYGQLWNSQSGIYIHTWQI